VSVESRRVSAESGKCGPGPAKRGAAQAGSMQLVPEGKAVSNGGPVGSDVLVAGVGDDNGDNAFHETVREEGATRRGYHREYGKEAKTVVSRWRTIALRRGQCYHMDGYDNAHIARIAA